MSPVVTFADGLDFLNVKFDPKIPGANQDVTITIDSFGADLSSSEIIWYEDKDPLKQGIGEKSLMVHTGDFGEVKHIHVVVLSNLGKRVEKTIAIVPAEIDFLWEAQTYTPPFYKGKAMPTFKSLVKVTAIPRYGELSSDPKSFIYDWKYNRTLGVGHGLGKNSTIIQMGYAGTPVPVSVSVTAPNDGWTGEYTTSINAREALVRFYEQAPLLGTNFNKALLGSITSAGNQFTIKAVPYFFSTDDIADNALLYTWTVNNRNSVPGLDPTTMVITKIGTEDEQKQVQQFTANLKIQTPRHLLQEGTTRALINLPAEQN